jgi:hypothetical protein
MKGRILFAYVTGAVLATGTAAGIGFVATRGHHQSSQVASRPSPSASSSSASGYPTSPAKPPDTSSASLSSPLSTTPSASTASAAVSGVWTTGTYGSLTVSYPADWVSDPANADGFGIRAPNQAEVIFGGPTAGTWDASSCNQYALGQHPGGNHFSSSQNVLVSGVSTTEYIFVDTAGSGYAVPVYISGNGACEAIFTIGSGGIDGPTFNRVLASVQFH